LRAGGFDRTQARGGSQFEIDGVYAHQALTALYFLSRVDQALNYLAGDAKTEIALYARCYDTGEPSLWL